MERGEEILPGMQPRAAEAAGLLRLLGNDKRLLVLCHLVGGEKAVGELAGAVSLSQSALSQHLALLRDSGVVATRRQAQAVFYRLADPKAAEVLGLLHRLYCHDDCKQPS